MPENVTSHAIKPCLQYVGSKVRLASRINALLGSSSGSYVEPFFGSGAVLLSRTPSKVELVNDAHSNLVAFYRVLRDERTRYQLIDALAHTPYARDEYNDARSGSLDFDSDPVESARRFFVLSNQGYVASDTGTWTSTMNPSAGHSNASKWNNYRTRLFAVAERLQNIQIENTDALAVVRKVSAVQAAGLAMYADPPYLHETRNGSKYAHDDMTPDDHESLLGALRDLPGPTVVSGYPSGLYDTVLTAETGWSRVDVASAGNSAAGRGSVNRRTEVLWFNAACTRPERQLQVLFEGRA